LAGIALRLIAEIDQAEIKGALLGVVDPLRVDRVVANGTNYEIFSCHCREDPRGNRPPVLASRVHLCR